MSAGEQPVTIVYDEVEQVRAVRGHLVELSAAIVVVRTVGRPVLPAEAGDVLVVVVDGDGELVAPEFVLGTRMAGEPDIDAEGRFVVRLAREPRRPATSGARTPATR